MFVKPKPCGAAFVPVPARCRFYGFYKAMITHFYNVLKNKIAHFYMIEGGFYFHINILHCYENAVIIVENCLICYNYTDYKYFAFGGYYMNKQQLASKIWESANKMRSKIEANEYKDYILGFIFYKFLSDKEVKYLKENDWTDEYLPMLDESDTETVTTVQKNIGYFIPYKHLFSTWLEKGNDFTADDVTVALSSFRL